MAVETTKSKKRVERKVNLRDVSCGELAVERMQGRTDRARTTSVDHFGYLLESCSHLAMEGRK